MSPVLVLGGLGFAGLLYLLYLYRALENAREQVEYAWHAVDHLLAQRNVELTNLARVCQDSGTSEQGLLNGIQKTRMAFEGAVTIPEKAKLEDQAIAVMQALLTLIEKYPAVKSAPGYADVRADLLSIQTQILEHRRRYNDAVKVYNALIAKPPYKILAGLFDYLPHEPF